MPGERFCADCRWRTRYRVEKRGPWWTFGLLNRHVVAEVCTHPNNRDEITGDHQRLYPARGACKGRLWGPEG